MRKIVLFQNAVVSVLITVIAIMTGFYELTGWKLLLVAVMGCILIDRVLLYIERLYLQRRKGNEKKGKAEGKRGTVPGIYWFKMRFRGAVKKDRHTRGHVAQIQERTRYNTAQPSAFDY